MANKNARILEALEPPLSAGMLWVHVSLLEALEEQMQQWNPEVRDQPDDLLDAAAGAVTDQPVRVGKLVAAGPARERQDIRPASGTYEVELEA